MADVEPIKETLEQTSERLKKDSEEVICEKCQSDGHRTEDHGKLGGARKGAGMPKGKKTKKTLEQSIVNAAFRQRVMKNVDKLFNAQLQLAMGEQVLMVKITEGEGKNRKTYHEHVTDQETIKEFLDEGDGFATTLGDEDHWYYLSSKPANNQALESLLNRGLGKAPDKLEVEGGFFTKTKLIVKVVGSKHGDIEFGNDGQIVGTGDTDGDDTVGAPGPSDPVPGTPTDS